MHFWQNSNQCGSFVPLSKVGRVDLILGVSHFGLIFFCVYEAWD